MEPAANSKAARSCEALLLAELLQPREAPGNGLCAVGLRVAESEGRTAMKKPPAIAGGDVVPQGEAVD